VRWGPALNRGGGSDADHDGVLVAADAGRGCNGGYCWVRQTGITRRRHVQTIKHDVMAWVESW
jgi:hypothetical protein